MSTQHPHLPALNDALAKSQQWMEATVHLLDGLEFDSTLRRKLSVALHELSMEHHKAIHTLIENNIWGSAFALLRPQLDGYVRGMWYGACANEKQLKEHFQDIDPPPFKEQVRQLEAIGAVDSTLMQIHTKSWRELCSFTHGGISQMRNRIGVSDIGAQYRLQDVEKLIGASSVLVLSACAGIGRVIEDAPFVVSATKAYDSIYGTAIAQKLPGSGTS